MTPPSTMDEFTGGLAETITKQWASFDRSPRRAEIRESLRIAIHKAIVQELIVTNDEEMRGVGAKW